MSVEKLAAQSFLAKTAQREVQKAQSERTKQELIDAAISGEQKRFDVAFGSDIRLYLEQDCGGNWARNHAPSLLAKIGDIPIAIRFSQFESSWEWRSGEGVQSGNYQGFYGEDLRELMLSRIGALIVKKQD